jgi:hypothetical protein
MWTHQIKGCHAIVFVIDSYDKERLSIVKEEVERLVKSRGKAHLSSLTDAHSLSFWLSPLSHTHTRAQIIMFSVGVADCLRQM